MKDFSYYIIVYTGNKKINELTGLTYARDIEGFDRNIYSFVIDKTAPIVSSCEVVNADHGKNVIIKFNEQVKQASETTYAYTKTINFTQDAETTLTFYDKAGNSVNVPVSINGLDISLRKVGILSFFMI